MMKKPYMLLLLCFVVLIACDKDETSPLINVDSTAGINLQDVKIGNKATYVMYQSECNGNFQFTGDTLNISVIERNDSLFLQESYSLGSSRERTTEHAVFPKEGYVLIPQRFNSEFLFFYGNDTIFLDREPTVQLKQSGCSLFLDQNPFIGDAIGSVEEFKFGGIHISNKKSISCVPGSFGVDAYIFYGNYLSAVHIIQTGLSDNVLGFVAIK